MIDVLLRFLATYAVHSTLLLGVALILDFLGRPRAPEVRELILRAALFESVLTAVVGYAVERQWLDFANETTWLGVVGLLELEVRVPVSQRRVHRWRRVLAAVLYALLLAFLCTWAVRGVTGDNPRAAWLDTWDAIWWLVAFVVIELNVFGWASHPQRGHAGVA